MIRVVTDSNVYISALNFGGVADEVLALGRRHVITLFVSPSILEEVEGVLVRKFKWSPKRAQRLVGNISLVHQELELLEHQFREAK